MKRITARSLILTAALVPALVAAHPGHEAAGPIAGLWHLAWSFGFTIGVPILGLAAFAAGIVALGRLPSRAARAQAPASPDA
jgi:hypothetical protein